MTAGRGVRSGRAAPRRGWMGLLVGAALVLGPAVGGLARAGAGARSSAPPARLSHHPPGVDELARLPEPARRAWREVLDDPTAVPSRRRAALVWAGQGSSELARKVRFAAALDPDPELRRRAAWAEGAHQLAQGEAALLAWARARLEGAEPALRGVVCRLLARQGGERARAVLEAHRRREPDAGVQAFLDRALAPNGAGPGDRVRRSRPAGR